MLSKQVPPFAQCPAVAARTELPLSLMTASAGSAHRAAARSWATVLASALSLTCTAAAASDASSVQLQAEQARALGVQLVAAVAAPVVAAKYPAQVVLPSGQQQVVATPLPGLVTELRVSAGDKVQAGQVLAVLRSPQAHELQRELQVAVSQQQLADAALQRDEALYREGLIPVSRVEASRAAEKQAALLRDERRRTASDAGLLPGSATLQLRSPLQGVVLERLASVGERVDAAAPLIRLGNVARLWVELQVPVRELQHIRPGDTVKVGGSDATGRVLNIGQTVQAASQTVLVRAEFSAAAGLRVGQAIEAMHERATPDARQVPNAAITSAGGHPALFVAGAQGSYRLTPVQVLGQSGTHAVVRGVPAGSQVVSAGVASLKAALAASLP